MGFEGSDMVVTINPEDPKPVDKLEIGCLKDHKSWIFLPREIKVEAAKDGEKYTLVNIVRLDIPENMEPAEIKTINLGSIPGTYQSLKITVKNIGACPEWHPGAGGKAWLFVDELLVH